MNELVSFVTPTFGRAARQLHLINEMLYWFTRQTYPNCELVILNDAPDQLLVCATPGVRIVNQPYRCRSLGEKMNILLAHARGDIVVIQEDDDISLPNRAAQAVKYLTGFDYWTPMLWYYAQERQPMVADNRGVGHNCAAYRRTAMEDRYDPITHGHDSAAHSWALANLRVNPNALTDPREITYIYRWGVSDLHLSGKRDMALAYATAEPGPAGYYKLAPEMGRDYVKLTAEAARGTSHA